MISSGVCNFSLDGKTSHTTIIQEVVVDVVKIYLLAQISVSSFHLLVLKEAHTQTQTGDFIGVQGNIIFYKKSIHYCWNQDGSAQLESSFQIC